MQSRNLTNFEKGFIISQSNVQFSVQLKDKNLISRVCDNMIKEIFAFRLRIEGDRMCINENFNPNIIKIPKNLKSAEEASNFIQLIPLDYNETLANIAVGENHVAVNISHMICDGGFILNLYSKLLDDPSQKTKTTLLPKTVDMLFQNEMNKIKDSFTIDNYNNELANIPYCFWSNEKECPKFVYGTPANYINEQNDVEDFQFYKNKSGLSESLWTMWPLTLMALSGESRFDQFGVSSCVDMRALLPKSRATSDKSIGDCFIDLNLCLKNINVENLTIREVGKLFRAKLNEKRKNGGFYEAYMAMDHGFQFPDRNICAAQLSNIGKFTIKSPFSDCWVQNNMITHPGNKFASISTFSRVSSDYNKLNIRLQSMPMKISRLDSSTLIHSLVFGMKEIPIDTTMKDAFNEIRQFQRDISNKTI